MKTCREHSEDTYIGLKMGLADKVSKDRRLELGSAFLVVNAFIWFYFSENAINYGVSKISSDFTITQLIWTVHFVTLALCLIVGVMLTNRIGRRRFFIFWTALGIVSPFALFALNFAPVPMAFLIAILFAASIGLGMPSCMEYFMQSTKNGNRGRYAGFILLFSALGLFSLRLIGGGIELTSILLAVWRSFGLLGVFVIKPFSENVGKKANISYRSVVQQRSFILYIIPFAMFSLVNFLSIPVQLTVLSPSTVTFLQIIEDAVAGIGGVAGGFLLDYIGRKPAAIAGFVMLGLGYSLLGLYPKAMLSWYSYTVIDGVTWGILVILFLITIWGELNPIAYTDKYYALGALPFFFSQFLSNTFPNYISFGISSYALFSFIAFFLFIAVLPLVYAPETLPEKIMKDRDLKSYIAKATEKAQKEANKSQKKNSGEAEKGSDNRKQEQPDQGESPEFEKARKLAEQYY